jgi:diguanylate cyclase (GGDEF)-like protein
VERTPQTALALDGVELPALFLLSGEAVAIQHVSGPLEAARELAASGPTYILFRADAPWQRRFLAGLPDEQRPATVAIGRSPAGAEHLADEWLSPSTATEELLARLQLASRRARSRRRRARRGFSDGLTGLPNRRAVVRALVRERDRSRRAGGAVSLVLIDLDGFKRVNEERGHDEGDRLLRRVGSTLRKSVRGPESCGRIGGDEFAIVVAGDVAEANRVARRVCTALWEIGVRATAGVHELSAGQSLKSLYRAADAQLRTAKRRIPDPRPEPLRVEIDPRSALGIAFPTQG